MEVKHRKFVGGVTTIWLALALAGGTVHAGNDGPIRWSSQAVYSTVPVGKLAAQQRDPISGTFKLNAQYWQCTEAPTVPICTHLSTLTFWAIVDLGYRHHKVIGKSAVTFGAVPWGAWTAKQHRMVCAEGGTGVLCGPWLRVPHTKNQWSLRKTYTPFRLMSGDWFFFQASACFDDFCGSGRNRSVPVYCRAKQEQCYFDV